MSGPDAGAPAEADRPGLVPFARLTSIEYRNTLRDLVGLTQLEPGLLSPGFDNWQGPFASGAGRGPNDVDTITRIAFLAAEAAAKNLAALLPCPPLPAGATEEEACAQKFIAQFGLRAYRRPLDDPEQAALLALYRALRGPQGQADFTTAIRLLIEAMLQSPFFVYRWEVTPPLVRDGSLVRFGAYEVASRLSYGLWASMPDEALFAAAAANQLQTPDQLEGQARRLLADPRARDMLLDFHAQLLGAIDLPAAQKDPALGYSAELGQSMLAETSAFVGDLIAAPGAHGTLEDLLTSPSTFVDARLAKIYGLADIPPTGMVPVKLDPAQRAGLLTQATFLTGNGGFAPDDPSVVQRGLRAYQNILCQTLAVVNASVPAPREPQAGATTRERFAQHSMDPCAKCHLSIDPLGFAFDNYDPVGAYRTREPGSPKEIDATGALELPSGELRWHDGVELVHQLAHLPEVRACLGQQWFGYLMHRPGGPGDARSLLLASESFQRSSYALVELIVGLVRTRAFTHRTPADGEALP